MTVKNANIAQNLKIFIEKKFNGNSSSCARSVEMSPQAFKKYVDGDREPGAGVLLKLANLGCDIHWLITGEYALNPEILDKLELLDKRIQSLEASNYRLMEENNTLKGEKRKLEGEIEEKDQENQVLRVQSAQIDKALKSLKKERS